MKCEKCGGEWIPPKNRFVSLTSCPFCGTPILNAEKAGGYTDMGEFLAYLVSLYGEELYRSCQKLNNLIADLYRGDERMKRAYRHAIVDDTLPQRIYELSLKPLNERKAYYDQIIVQFSEANFYSSDLGKQIVDSFTSGLRLELLPPISTKATDEDGKWVDEYGVVYSADRRKLIRGNKNLINYMVKEGTVVVCDRAFYRCCSLISLALPSSLTSIGEKAFRGCHSLSGLTLPASLTSIGDWAFSGCSSLSSLTLPVALTSIGNWAFSGCSSLSSLTLPISVINIGGKAFPENENFTLLLEGTEHFVIKDDILYTAYLKKIIWYPKFKSERIIIPDTVTNIGDWAFSGCSSLSDLTLPASLTSIGDWAFNDCSSLRNLTLPASLTSIGEGVFCGCKFLSSLTLPPSLTSIGDGAFWDCRSLDDLTLPASLTSIGESAFENCESLSSLTLPSSLTSIGDGAFSGCSSLSSLTLPISLISIGNWVFSGCCSLRNLVLPAFLTSIGDRAFWGCSSLSSLTLPSSLTSIGDGAFADCSSLRTIYIPIGSMDKFKRLLPNHLHDKLKEI